MRLGVQGNMFLIFSLLTLILIITSFSFFYFYISNRIEKQGIENMEQLTLDISEQIETFYVELNHISFQIINNSELLEIMQQAVASDDNENYFTDNVETARNMKNVLATIKSPGLKETRIRIYNDEGDYISLGATSEDNNKIRSRLQSYSFHASYVRFVQNDIINFSGPHTDLFSNDKSEMVVSFYRIFRNYMETFGVIEFQLKVSELERKLRLPNLTGMEVYLFDKDGQPAYMKKGDTTQKDMILKQLLAIQSSDYSTASKRGHLNQSNYIITYQQSPLSHWNIVLVQPKSVMLSSIKVVGRLTVIVSIVFILLSFITIFVITRQLTKRIRKISSLIRHASLDNPSIKTDETNNEFILIHRAFDIMIARMKISMELDVQARSRELRARMNALESQMNPHFLYNVLTVIGAVGEQAGVDKVMSLCEKLSGMLRYTSNNQAKEVTIRDELIYAQQYLDLMEERYENHFQYRLEMDEATLTSKVPRLILQPLIENCFKHAFQKSSPPWVIHLSIEQTTDYCWLFEVKDWGDGFDRAILNKLHRKMESDDKSASEYRSEAEESSGNQGGIGLFNTLIRMRLTYETQAFYEIVPNEPVGTIVRIGVKRNVFKKIHETD